MVFKMIKQIIIFVKDKEFYDDAQLLARSFFTGATAIDGDKWDKNNTDVSELDLKCEPVIMRKTEMYCIINADFFVPALQDRTGSRGEIHDRFKKELYIALVKVTGKSLPWGFLTGVRPAKRAGEIIEDCVISGRTEEKEMIGLFCDRFFASEEKARLAFDVARNEKRILESAKINRSSGNVPDNGFSLYVGIPFCPSTCLYCSFASVSIGKCDKSFVEAYIEALCHEINECGRMAQNRYKTDRDFLPVPSSVYIGGGTPTALEADYLQRIIKCVKKNFAITPETEFTVEAGRPDSITADRLQVLKDEGINRISVNPQTMNDETLRLIGRNHTASDVEKAFFMAREFGFNNINMDIILGLPGETKEHVRHTSDSILRLKPDSLTVHCLAIKRASGLNIKREEYEHLQPENTRDIIRITEELAKGLGMNPYYMYRQQNMAGNFENVGYAKEGKESLYNIVIMEEVQDIIAVGAGASSKFIMPGNRYERAINVKSVSDYIERTDEMINRKYSLLGCD